MRAVVAAIAVPGLTVACGSGSRGIPAVRSGRTAARLLLRVSQRPVGPGGLDPLCRRRQRRTRRPGLLQYPPARRAAVGCLPTHDLRRGRADSRRPDAVLFSRKWVAFTTDGRDPHDPRLAVADVASGKATTVAGFNGYTSDPVWAPDSSRLAVGGYQAPVEVFSPRGRRLSAIRERGAAPIAWTRAGIFLLPESSAWATAVLRIPNGSSAARTVVRLPSGQVLVSAQPF